MNWDKNNEWLEKDELDEILSKKAREFKVEKITSEEIDTIISKAKAQKRREKYLIAASITVMIILVLSTFYIYKSRLNKENTENPTLVAEEESNFEIIIDEEMNKTTSIADSLTLEHNVDILTDITNIEILKGEAQQIVIAKVIEIERCTNYNEKIGNYTLINTLGNIEILQVLKGDLNINSKTPFIRAGGTISYDEYQKGVIYGNRSQIQGAYDYITERKKGDIKIEEGKTYLMFLYYSEYDDRYEIMAYQYGLREYNQENNTVLNNETGEWEDLNNILN